MGPVQTDIIRRGSVERAKKMADEEQKRRVNEIEASKKLSVLDRVRAIEAAKKGADEEKDRRVAASSPDRLRRESEAVRLAIKTRPVVPSGVRRLPSGRSSSD